MKSTGAKTFNIKGEEFTVINDYGEKYLCINEFGFNLKRIQKLVSIK